MEIPLARTVVLTPLRDFLELLHTRVRLDTDRRGEITGTIVEVDGDHVTLASRHGTEAYPISNTYVVSRTPDADRHRQRIGVIATVLALYTLGLLNNAQ